MFKTDPDLSPCKERKSLPPEVVEESFRILAEEDVEQEKRRQMKQQLSTQRRKSLQLYRIAKNDYWSDDNDDLIQPNHREIPYQLRGRSTLQSVKGKEPNFDTIDILKGDNGSEEIIICKVIDESHSGNLELTRLDACGDDPILYIVGTMTHGHIQWMMLCMFKWCMQMKVASLCYTILHFVK